MQSIENKTQNKLFNFTLKVHGGLGELAAAQQEYGSAAADGWRMNPEGHSMGAGEVQQLQGMASSFSQRLVHGRKEGQGKQKAKGKDHRGHHSQGTILMPHVRLGSKAGVKRCLPSPAVILRTQVSSVVLLQLFFGSSQYRQVKINPKKAFRKKDRFLQLRDGTSVSQLS